MSIYEKPTKVLMGEWAAENLGAGQSFGKATPIRWFATNYPKIKSNTVAMHVEGMAVNSGSRKHHPNIRPGSGHDLFYKTAPGQFRLWEPATDPQPFYKEGGDRGGLDEVAPDEEQSDENGAAEGKQFAFEKDLQNYLVRNLATIEQGLRLYEEEEITGIEFSAGGRFIDILAVDKSGAYVVIELKVSRGYDRVVGQLLRYMGWVEQNLEPTQPVRGLIVASDITPDLRLACSRVAGVGLVEYEIAFKLRPISIA